MQLPKVARAVISAEAALDSYYWGLRRLLHRSGKYLFLAAMPKSGSTFLSRALCHLTGFEHAYFGTAYFNVEQELYLPRILDAYGRGTVVQQHIKANRPNLDILDRFGVRPTVVTRNLVDVIVSARDHLLNESVDNLPTLIVPSDFASLGYEEQIDIVIAFFCPWLIAFYVSWYCAERRDGLDLMWLSYEDAVEDWPGAIEQVLDFHGLAASDEEVLEALATVTGSPWTRMNKGVVGRGEKRLTDRQKNDVLRMTDWFGDVDFARVGLSP